VSTDFAPPAPPGRDVDWHPVPARQFMVILKDKYEVSVSDGETRLFGPGELALVEDLTRKGQYTKNVSGSEENLVLVTQLSDE